MREPFRWKSVVPVVTAVAAVIAVVTLTVRNLPHRDGTELASLYRIGEHVKAREWTRLYEGLPNSNGTDYQSSPLTLPLVGKLAAVPFRKAKLIWFWVQVLSYLAGLLLVGRTLWKTGARPVVAVASTAIAILLTIPFFLNDFQRGGISSLVFLGASVAFLGWTARLPRVTAAGILGASLFSPWPAFLYFLLILCKEEWVSKVWDATITLFGLVLAATLIFLGSGDAFSSAIDSWLNAIGQDLLPESFAVNTNQTLMGALYRWVVAGLASVDVANVCVMVATIVFCVLIAVFWMVRRPTSTRASALFFCLGLFPYLWFTRIGFLHQFTILAIPLAVIAARAWEQPLSWPTIATSAFAFGLGGSEESESSAVFLLQYSSVPFLATFVAALDVVRQAVEGSETSPAYQALRARLASDQDDRQDQSAKRDE